ncbi:cell division protein FtsN [Luteimonas cucumeris]|uniref:Cell division protein FtsN n=1 Tax=Luteimonas cucumeris TaxID=985012 RepID=A0A562LE71_9GAMM|nr:SPOR domain-containing protein [Luteimonas cucumeris]TWI05835.1 cell division protein FtsN [Luteimonas cucumeris]
MAARRGKTQAKRNNGNGIPGWAWMILGVVLTIGVVLFAPKLLKSDGKDGFFRPKPNPDAQPAAASSDDGNDAVVPEGIAAGNEEATKPGEAAPESDYDFYTLLPGKEVKMSDAELAATAREEEARQRRANATTPPATNAAANDAPATTATVATSSVTTATATTPAAASSDNSARYMLQAGAFGASGDAEALKARIALLGLNARVESASIGGKTVYRVRMGPYGSASELAEAKGKLGNGGLPAMAIKAQ